MKMINNIHKIELDLAKISTKSLKLLINGGYLKHSIKVCALIELEDRNYVRNLFKKKEVE